MRPPVSWALPLLLVSAGICPFPAAAFDHSAWDRLLAEHVKEGVVDYGGFTQDYQALQAYLKTLETVDLSALEEKEKLALLLNAYNAHCIAGVVSQGSIESVQDVWFFFKRTKFVLAGEEHSLDSLEHQVIRKLGDPRVHFALVCSAKSCPSLACQAYTGATLDEALDRQGKAFLADPTKNRLDKESGTFHLSKIFQWFKEDFTQQAPSLLAYLPPFLSESDAAYLKENRGDTKVEYLDYDWSLNGHF
jgi:hypothetical protein